MHIISVVMLIGCQMEKKGEALKNTLCIYFNVTQIMFFLKTSVQAPVRHYWQDLTVRVKRIFDTCHWNQIPSYIFTLIYGIPKGIPYPEFNLYIDKVSYQRPSQKFILTEILPKGASVYKNLWCWYHVMWLETKPCTSCCLHFIINS